jgi:hypothetical protein
MTPIRNEEHQAFRSLDEFRDAFFPADEEDRLATVVRQENTAWPPGADLADAVLAQMSEMLPSE